MSLQLIFVVETNKTCKSDWIYIKDTIDYFFEYDRTAIKLTPVYMDGKGKYKNKEKEISKNIAAYKAGGKGRQTKVIYCFDCDDYNTKQEDAFFLEKVRQYCAEQKYDFVWFCKDIERVYTGKKVNAVDIKHFISLIRKCKEPTEISDLMFAELIDKIVVYEAEGVGKARTQKVDIYFNYVGQVDIAYTEEELAEIKAQEEQIEMERLAKQREREKAYREKRKAKKLAENGGEIVKTKICPHCQKEFVPTSNRQIFCSKDCCYQARQDKTKADREAEKGNHYYRQRVCAVCGSTYWPTHSQQKFCSEECQKINHNEKSLEFYHKKQKEKSECKDLLQTKELVSSTNSSEIITIPA